MQPAELNYEIYDKDLLAIFKAFQQCATTSGLCTCRLVLSDHQEILEYACKLLKAAHASPSRWSETSLDYYLIRYHARSGWVPNKMC